MKIVQVGNNLNIFFEGKKVTLSVKDIDVNYIYKLGYIYNNTQSDFTRNKILKLFPDEKFVNEERIQRNLERNKLRAVVRKYKEFKIISKQLGYDNYIFPKEFAEMLIAAKEKKEDVSPYINFIKKLSQNPVENVKKNFFTYMENCKIKLTPSGNIIAYRYVLSKEDFNRKEVLDIHKEYFRVKSMKKSPKNYKWGTSTLQKAFDSISLTFTDNYTKLQNYQVGSIINMDWSEADTSTNTCSDGYHFTNFEGLDKLPYNFGNQLIVGIINPENIAAIPLDNYPKFRCVEWYFAGIIDEEFTKEIEDNISVFDLDYEYQTEIPQYQNSFTNTKIIKKKMKENKEKMKDVMKNSSIIINPLITV